MKKVFLILIFSAISLFGDPAPFGFELGKATFEEVSKKYPDFKLLGNSLITKGRVFKFAQKNFDLKGLNDDVIFHFNAESKLVFMLLYFDKDRFDDLLSSLSKYKIVEKYNDFAKFEDGKSIILLYISGFKTVLMYENEKWTKLYEDYEKTRTQK